MLWSAQQGKIKLIKKKCCSAADVISAELGSACVYLSSLHESSRQSHSTVPVPTEGLLQLSKTALFPTAVSSGCCTAQKRLIRSVIWGGAGAYARLRVGSREKRCNTRPASSTSSWLHRIRLAAKAVTWLPDIELDCALALCLGGKKSHTSQ